MTRTRSVVIGFSIVVFGGVLIFLMLANKPKPPKKELKDSTPLVEVFNPRISPVTFEVISHGIVSPRTETSLVSEVSGLVQKVSDKFVAGGFFRKGDILLQIDPTEYQVGVEQAKARLAGQKAKYLQEEARSKQAQKEWDLSGRARGKAPALALRKPFLLEAEANMQSAESDLKKAQQKLARTIIRAPYDGMVKSKLVDIGQFVGTGNKLGVTFAIDYAEVRLPLTDKELAFIDMPLWGEKNVQSLPVVDIEANYAGSIRKWRGQIVRMEGVVDQQSRVHYFVARVPDPYSVLSSKAQSMPLKVGTFVTARIYGKHETDLYQLPRSVFRDLTQVLVADKNSELHTRELEVVRAESDLVYVRSGLLDGDRIVTTSIDSPVQGQKVRVLGDEPQTNLPQDKKSFDTQTSEPQN